MRIRSTSELNDWLDRDLAWRKRELSAAKFLEERARNHEQSVLRRVGICLIYAHWEGFVKAGTEAYLMLVRSEGLLSRDLSLGMLTLSIAAQFRVDRWDHLPTRREIVDFLRSDLSKKADIKPEHALRTRDNLNSEVLKEILDTLGINPQFYDTKQKLLDEQLLADRNRIAHGEHVEIDSIRFRELHAEFIALLNRFRDDLMLAATQQHYRRDTVAPPGHYAAG